MKLSEIKKDWIFTPNIGATSYWFEQTDDGSGKTTGPEEVLEIGCQLEAENEALMGFIATVLCWKPAWAQTTYFHGLPENLRNDLLTLAKATKEEGSGGIDDEWLARLQMEGN